MEEGLLGCGAFQEVSENCGEVWAFVEDGHLEEERDIVDIDCDLACVEDVEKR